MPERMPGMITLRQWTVVLGIYLKSSVKQSADKIRGMFFRKKCMVPEMAT